MMAFNRSIKEKITHLLNLFPVVAIVGVRQCGKTTLVKQLKPEWKYYDLERADDYDLISKDPIGFFARYDKKLVLDEVQSYPALFNILRSVIDNNRNLTGRFIITGSSSPQLIRGISESLAGRIATVELAPLKNNELERKPISKIYELLSNEKTKIANLQHLETISNIKSIYNNWFYGGYPEPALKKGDFYPIWTAEYINNFIRRDIARLFPRINSDKYRLFIQSLASHSGKVINLSEIATALEVSSPTIKEYFEIIHNTFIWRNLRSFEKNSLKKVQKASKGFFRDQGILHYLLKIKTIDDLLLHPVAGFSFESFVIEELIRGFSAINEPNIDFYYYRTRDKSEIDLIIDGSFGIIPVEIKLGRSLNSRMLQSLKIFLEDMKLKFGLLINNAERIEMVDDKIIQIPACFI